MLNRFFIHTKLIIDLIFIVSWKGIYVCLDTYIMLIL